MRSPSAGPKRRKSAAETGGGEATTYRAPALEKGMDVLELLARVSDGMTLSQIAQNLGRSVQEVYRVVLSLERRGYVGRRPPADAFHLTMKLFDLASNFPPIRRLTEAAQPILPPLAVAADQALILSILDGVSVRVVAQADNPAPIGFRVRLGAQNPALRTASGRTLLAFQPGPVQAALLDTIAETSDRAEFGRLSARLAAIRANGYEMISGETLRGITDVSFPILDGDGVAQGVLTMPFLVWVANRVTLEEASELVFAAAATLSAAIGGKLDHPRFPLVEAIATR